MKWDTEASSKYAQKWVSKKNHQEPKNPTFELAISQPVPTVLPSGPKLRVICIDHGRGAVGYYRLGVPFYYLRKMGLCETLLFGQVLEGAIGDTLRAFHEAVEWAQIIVMSRPYCMAQIRFLVSARDRGKCVVIDTDDHLEAVEELGPNPMGNFWEEEQRNFYSQGLALADHVTVASMGLKTLYEDRWPGKVTFLPNPVDTASSRWNISHSKYPDHPFTIGLAAGHSHGYDLELVREPLLAILREFPDVRLKVIGLMPEFLYDFPGKQLTLIPGTDFDDFPEALADIDVVLCPLVDHSFNRSKTDTKGFESTLAGCAVIASPIGEYQRWSTKSLLFATDSQSWIDQMRNLILYPERAKELNKNAVRYVLGFRSAAGLVSLWESCYRRALRDKKNESLPYGARSMRLGD